MDVANLLWCILFGSIGMGYFIYGKKQANAVVRYTGVGLMVYPYFIGNTLALVLVGVILLFLPKFLKI